MSMRTMLGRPARVGGDAWGSFCCSGTCARIPSGARVSAAKAERSTLFLLIKSQRVSGAGLTSWEGDLNTVTMREKSICCFCRGKELRSRCLLRNWAGATGKPEEIRTAERKYTHVPLSDLCSPPVYYARDAMPICRPALCCVSGDSTNCEER